MSLKIQLSNLSTRLGTEFKSIRTVIGTLASLSTTEKGSLVGAINEVFAAVGSGGTITADSITDATAVGKASMRAATQLAGRQAIGAGTSDLVLGTLSTNAKRGDYTPTWGEVSGKPSVMAVGSDAAAARTTISVSSTAEMNAAIASAIDDLVDGAPGALDTLKEIADKIAAGDTDLSAVATGLGNRVRVDAAQSFTELQKGQARSNIDVYSKTEIGDPETDLVAVFEAALV